jgi:hypothetical protein
VRFRLAHVTTDLQASETSNQSLITYSLQYNSPPAQPVFCCSVVLRVPASSSTLQMAKNYSLMVSIMTFNLRNGNNYCSGLNNVTLLYVLHSTDKG